ncbi:MAG: radical SAM protein [Armatimonadota bacterium]
MDHPIMDANEIGHPAELQSDFRHLTVPKNIRLRQERFGGIVFNTSTGTMIELDRDAMTMFQCIQDAGIIQESNLVAVFARHHRQLHQVIEQLLETGILTEAQPISKSSAAKSENDNSPVIWPPGPHLVAPETVHWALTYRCESHCPDCYARRHSSTFADELDTQSALQVVDILAQWKVFQIAFGGGEPLLRDDLAAICKHACQQGVVVHVTTGQHQIAADVLKNLSASISMLQIGVKHEKLLADPDMEVAILAESVRKTLNAGIHTGANLMLSNTVIDHFEDIIGRLVQAGLDRITLLRYKPPADRTQWNLENPSVEVWREIEKPLVDILRQYSDVAWRIDCALSFLQRHLKPSEASAAGIRGCVAADRILALTPDGSIFPCSQLVHPNLRAGNILTDDLQKIWTHSKVIKKYRAFRSSGGLETSWCGICTGRDHCGGCRVFARDGLGGEPECVEPVTALLDQLGKTGRRLDLQKYIAGCDCISIGEYMERYGVGQKRASQELRAASDILVLSGGSTGRKQQDVYWSRQLCDLYDMQDSIGYTSGGAPFVSLEEIAELIDEDDIDSQGSYPGWLSAPEFVHEMKDNQPNARRRRKRKKRR